MSGVETQRIIPLPTLLLIQFSQESIFRFFTVAQLQPIGFREILVMNQILIKPQLAMLPTVMDPHFRVVFIPVLRRCHGEHIPVF